MPPKKVKKPIVGGGDDDLEDFGDEDFDDDLLDDDLDDDLDDLAGEDFGDDLEEKAGDDDTNPGFAESDQFDEKNTSAQRKKIVAVESGEITLGPWRDRAFAPRGTMPKQQILSALDRALKLVALRKGRELKRVRNAFKAEVLPLLQQAVDQAGGDGMDAYLVALKSPPGKPASSPLIKQLTEAMQQVNQAADVPSMVEQGKKVSEVVKRALETPAPLSRLQLEEEFEGKLGTDTLLAIMFASDDELAQKLSHLEQSLETLRNEIRQIVGMQPTSLLFNFTRLKIEKKVVEAEKARRALPRG